MSETSAKAIRAAREAKAKRLGSAGDPKAKVDASTWTPPEMMNTEAKTGLRPVSRRAYKRGGKVGMEADGSCGPTRADRKPRKSGGEAKSWVAEKINRNVKEANAELGKPHTGGLKAGGRAKRAAGGDLPLPPTPPPGGPPRPSRPAPRPAPRPPSYEEDTTPPRGMRGFTPDMTRGGVESGEEDITPPRGMMRKHGGRSKKMDGGPMSNDPRQRAARMQQEAAAVAGVPTNRMEFGGLRKGKLASMAGLKKGGKVSHQEWEHSKADLQQDRKLAKKHGMSMEKWENSKLDEKHDKQQSAEGLKKGGAAGNYTGGTRPTGGRVAKASGGRAKGGKGKTNIIISINPGAGAAAQTPPGNFPPGGAPRPGGAAAMPPPPPMPPPGMPMAGAPPMPMPPPGGMPMPPPGMPMYRGGRAAKQVGGPMMGRPMGMPPQAMGAPAMPPQAMGNPGVLPAIAMQNIQNRLNAGNMPPQFGMMPNQGVSTQVMPQASAIPGTGGPGAPAPMFPVNPAMQQPQAAQGMQQAQAAQQMRPMGRKAGGRAYRSYKDMDAGAGSGMGRLEKTEIAEHKRGERKAGGRTYRSYKDMDAGAGSGLGRLEKTEIQARKK